MGWSETGFAPVKTLEVFLDTSDIYTGESNPASVVDTLLRARVFAVFASATPFTRW